MSSNRPETSVPRDDDGEEGAPEAQLEASVSVIGVPGSYVPSIFDLVAPTHRARDTTKLYIPPEYLRSEAVDSSVLIGQGASFTVTRHAIPPAPKYITQRADVGGFKLEQVKEAPKRPKFIVYKSANVTFKQDGHPASPRDRRALLSVLTEFHTLLHPPLLKHPNIIDFLGLAWGSNAATPLHCLPVLVVEYGDRGTLADVQLGGPPLSRRAKLDISLGIARGLEVLHQYGIVHGDVKPENIIMCSSDDKEKTLVPKLADFGFALIEETESLQVIIGGTKTWRAPESFSPVSVSTLKLTDIYSFGLLVWSVAIDGRNPFDLLLVDNIRGNERLQEIDRLKQSGEVMRLAKMHEWVSVIQLGNMTSSSALEVLFFTDLDSVLDFTLPIEPNKRDLHAVIRLFEAELDGVITK